MASAHPEVTSRADSRHFEPLAVSPRQACLLLSIGTTRLYRLIGNGELESYLDGRSRKILMVSIQRRIARLLAEPDAIVVQSSPAPRKRGRPRKVISSDVQRRLDQLTHRP